MKELDPDVHWYPGLASLVGGLATVYRGHQGVRDYFGDLHDTLDEVRSEFPEIVTLTAESSRSATSAHATWSVVLRPNRLSRT